MSHTDTYQIKAINARREHTQTIVDIADNRLGRDYLSPDYVEDSLDDDSVYFTDVAITDKRLSTELFTTERAENQFSGETETQVNEDRVPIDIQANEVVGFCVGAVYTPNQINSYINICREELPISLQDANSVGVVRTVVVRSGFEKQGVGTELVEHCIEQRLQEDVEAIVVVGWEENGQVNIAGIMESLDFDVVGEFDEYWYEDSVTHDYQCRSCGDPPCTCSATIFVRYV